MIVSDCFLDFVLAFMAEVLSVSAVLDTKKKVQLTVTHNHVPLSTLSSLTFKK